MTAACRFCPFPPLDGVLLNSAGWSDSQYRNTDRGGLVRDLERATVFKLFGGSLAGILV